jgi:tetratricopeptide (TPR) repeat protein
MAWRRSLLVVLGALACGAALAEPVRPRDDATVLMTIPVGQSRSASELRLTSAELSRDPENLSVALRAARLAIEQGRLWSDPRRYGEAQAALAPWWSAPKPPEDVRVLRAVIQQALHDFPAALADLDAVLEKSPRNAQARLTRAFVRLAVGDIAGAREDCRSLPLAVGLLPAAACRARVAALSGSREEAYTSLSRSVARDNAADRTVLRFALVILADIAQGLGRDDDADRHFSTAVAVGEPDVPLLAAMADHLLDRDRALDVLYLLDGKGDADALVLRRAIAAKRTNDPRLGQWSATLNEGFAAAKQAGVRTHLREEARFRLEVEGDAVAALPLAIENWSTQKEIADARLLLECAAAARRPDAARDVIRFVQGAGLFDRRITPLVAQLREAAR